MDIVKTIFALDKSKDIRLLLSNKEATDIAGFSELLSILPTEACPKEIKEAVESVIVRIKMKEKPTAKEAAFLREITSLEEHLYAEGHHAVGFSFK